jgi:hypothetical protein
MEPAQEAPAPPPEPAADADYWCINKKTTKRWLKWLAGFAVLYLLLEATNLCSTHDYTRRAIFTEMYLTLTEVREIIGGQLETDPQAGIEASAADLILARFSTAHKGKRLQISYKNISRDGTITVFSPTLGALIVLRPQVMEGKVEWSCFGSSAHAEWDIPPPCRATREKPPEPSPDAPRT